MEERDLKEAQALLDEAEKRSKKRGGKKTILEGVSCNSVSFCLAKFKEIVTFLTILFLNRRK